MKSELVHIRKSLEVSNAFDPARTIVSTAGQECLEGPSGARHAPRPGRGRAFMLAALVLPAATVLGAVPRLVKDVNSQTIRTNSSNPGIVVEMNSLAFFAASNALSGVELWKSDGTEEGTKMVKDIYPGVTPSLGNLVAVRSATSEGCSLHVFFCARQTLRVSADSWCARANHRVWAGVLP